MFLAAVMTPASIWSAIRTAFTSLELVAVVFTLANVWLAIKEKIWTWPAGIVSVLLAPLPECLAAGRLLCDVDPRLV